MSVVCPPVPWLDTCAPCKRDITRRVDKQLPHCAIHIQTGNAICVGAVALGVAVAGRGRCQRDVSPGLQAELIYCADLPAFVDDVLCSLQVGALPSEAAARIANSCWR